MNLVQLQQNQQHPAIQNSDKLKVAMEHLASLQAGHLLNPDILAHNTQNTRYTQNSDSISQGGSSGRSTPSSDSAPGKLFVGGLSWQTNQEKLKEYFSQFGPVSDVLVMKDPISQRSRGFGFISFTNPDSVDRVLAVASHILDGKKIDPKPATPKSKSKSSKTKKIFVGGVSQETSAEEVKAYFNQFGKVEEAVMLMDQQTKRHRGFGFVTFEAEETVDRVCEIHFHTIKNKKVECKKAQPKEVVQAANTAALLGKRVLLSNLGMMPAAALGLGLPNALTSAAAAGFNGIPSPQHGQLQQLTASLPPQAYTHSVGAAYGKLVGGGTGPLSSYRYSPYPIPSNGLSAASLAAAAGGLQYTVAQPTNPIVSTHSVLSAITSNPHHPGAAGGPTATVTPAGVNSTGSGAENGADQTQQQLTSVSPAVAHALQQAAAAVGGHPGAAGVGQHPTMSALQSLTYPYQFAAAGLPGNFDLASMYSLPPAAAGMYTL